MLADRDPQTIDSAKSGGARHWERETALRVMTAYVAHELNHPLGTIINLANILARRLTIPASAAAD